MNIIISGYGKMGRKVEKELKDHNLYIVSRETNSTFNDVKETIDVIIDFSHPDQIYQIEKLFSMRVCGSASPKTCLGTIGKFRAVIKSE